MVVYVYITMSYLQCHVVACTILQCSTVFLKKESVLSNLHTELFME